MTKAEEILEKHLKNNLDQRLYLRSSRLTYNLCLDALNEAINYTRCSTELPTKEAISLELKHIANWDKLIGCPENQRQAYNNGFMHGIKFKRKDLTE